MAIGIRHTDHVAPSIRKELALTLPTSAGRLVDIRVVHSRAQAREIAFLFFCLYIIHDFVYKLRGRDGTAL
jgi:hypothetical protein